MQHEHSVEITEIYPRISFWQKLRENNVCTRNIIETVDLTKYFFGESKFFIFQHRDGEPSHRVDLS